MSGKRAREGSPDLTVSKKQLFPDLETEAPVVCAIDFGTARTGYAYVFTKQRDEIKVKKPGSQEPGKTHTSLLLCKQGKFLAFGCKAREDYYEHDESGMLFEKFKMRLHDDHRGSEPIAFALNGKTLSLLKVITHSLKYVKEDAMAEINRSQVKKLSPFEIKWVVTVPAIWQDVAKGMMRRAALDAGMIEEESSAKLVLCLEPEAACMACDEERLSEPGTAGNNVLKTGDNFMVLDCGGGTVDITMHRVEATIPLRLSEIRQPTGGPWGSTYVDAEFERFVESLIGEASWKRFKPSSAWVDMMKAWEETKIQFDPSEHSDDPAYCVRINLAAVLGDDVLGGMSLQACVDRYNKRNGSNLTLKRGTTILMSVLQMSSFFKKIVSKIVQQVKELVAENPVNYIYLVGGFAESKILQSSVKVEFENRKIFLSENPTSLLPIPASLLHVIVPMRPQLMVVKGAVLFGLRKGSTIQSRVARYTYGFDCVIQYDEKNPEHKQRDTQGLTSLKKTPRGEIRYVNGVFKALVKQGNNIRVSEKHTDEGYTIVGIGQTTCLFDLYSSSSPTARWTNDSGTKKIGKVEIPCVRGQKTSISMSFGNTEIMASATNTTTGLVRNATIKYDFNSL